jgi:hypothetical protein
MSVSRLCSDDIGIINVHKSVVLNDYILTATEGNIIINGTPLNITSRTGGSTIKYLDTGDTQGYLSFFQDTTGSTLNFANLMYSKTNLASFISTTDGNTSLQFLNGNSGGLVLDSFDQYITLSNGQTSINGGAGGSIEMLFSGSSVSLSSGNFMAPYTNFTLSNTYITGNLSVTNQVNVSTISSANLSAINFTSGNLYMTGDTINGTIDSFLQLNSVHSKLANGTNNITVNNTSNSIIISTNKLVHSTYSSVAQSLTGSFNTVVQTNNSYIGDIIMDTTASLTAGASVSFNVLNTNVNSKQIQLSFRYQGASGLPYIYISGFIQDVSFTVNIVNLDTSNPINGSDIFVVGYQITN